MELVALIVLIAFVAFVMQEQGKKHRERVAEAQQEELIRSLVREHAPTLYRKWQQLVHRDDYGNLVEAQFARELDYFFETVIAPRSGFGLDDDLMRLKSRKAVLEEVKAHIESHGLDVTEVDPEALDGLAFEGYCARRLERAGWAVHLTPGSGDQGIDILGTKDGVRAVFQCKKQRAAVGNSAVQEALAGKSHSGSDAAFVVTNACFTPAARQLANTTGVHLIHFSDLDDLSRFVPIQARPTRHPREGPAQKKDDALYQFFVRTTAQEVAVLTRDVLDVKAQDTNGVTALMVASIATAEPGVIRALVEAGADLEVRDSFGGTALARAAAYSSAPGVVTALLTVGAKVDSRDATGRTPLSHASMSNPNVEIIRALVDAGAALEARDETSYTPLMTAAAFNANPDVVRTLVSAGCNLDVVNKFGGWNALVIAAKYNGPEVVRALLDCGADPLARLRDDATPLMVVAGGCENPATIELLLERGAQVDAVNSLGETALHQAATMNPDTRVLQLLLDAGAELDARSMVASTPLHCAAEYNEESTVTRFLIGAGAEVDACTALRETPLMLAAAFNKNPDTVQVLLDAGASAMPISTEGKRAIDYAADNPNLRNSEAYWSLSDASY